MSTTKRQREAAMEADILAAVGGPETDPAKIREEWRRSERLVIAQWLADRGDVYSAAALLKMHGMDPPAANTDGTAELQRIHFPEIWAKRHDDLPF